MVWKTLEAQQRTNTQLNSHMALVGKQTRVTSVRGERFTYKPTIMPPMINIITVASYSAQVRHADINASTLLPLVTGP